MDKILNKQSHGFQLNRTIMLLGKASISKQTSVRPFSQLTWEMPTSHGKIWRTLLSLL